MNWQKGTDVTQWNIFSLRSVQSRSRFDFRSLFTLCCNHTKQMNNFRAIRHWLKQTVREYSRNKRMEFLLSIHYMCGMSMRSCRSTILLTFFSHHRICLYLPLSQLEWLSCVRFGFRVCNKTHNLLNCRKNYSHGATHVLANQAKKKMK